MDQFSEDDPDVAAFRAATKRARKSGMVGFARVVVAGAVAAAVGLAIFAGLASLYEGTHGGRRAGRRAVGSVVLTGFLCGGGSLLSFLLVYRLLGGKVDRDTWAVVKKLLLSPFR